MTIHGLLHVVDYIEQQGPVYRYWAFVMERFCGSLLPAIRSRKWPNASVKRRALEIAQLANTKIYYGLVDALSLSHNTEGKLRRAFPECKCLLLFYT
jgi:hypothetical protein